MNKGHWGQQGTMLATTLLVSICVVNCGYLFEGTFTPLEDFQFQSTLFGGRNSQADTPPEGANRFAGMWLGRLSVPLPANMVQGIDTQRYDFERGLSSYLRGEWARRGWWYFYLYALLIKVPLGTWMLMLIAVSVTLFVKGYSVSWRDEMVVLVPGVVILFFVSSQTGFSAHSRYVIPALPFFFVWMSKVGLVFDNRLFARKRLAMATAVGLALTWSVGSSLAVYPHSLSYFNELAAVLPTPGDPSYPKPLLDTQRRSIWATLVSWPSAGPRSGPRHLLNSNIDWGQDLLYLKDWLDGHSEVNLNGLAVSGSYPPSLIGIPETPMPPVGLKNEKHDFHQVQSRLGPKPGWYALSVNYIYDRDPQYRYFLNFEPVAMAGYSIYIYHITIDEANNVRKKLGLPEFVERGSEKSRNAEG